MKKKLPIQEKRGDGAYRIKNKKLGLIYVCFSDHGQQRMKERGVEVLDFLMTLTKASAEIAACRDDGDVLLVDTKKNMSIILSVSKTEKDIHYFNVITVLSEIPVDEEGQLKFYNINHFIHV